MRRAFLKSPHHAALAAATLGLGLASGEPLGLILGATAYVLGWVYLPDLGFFRRWAEGKAQAQLAAEADSELAQFNARRDVLLTGLTASRRQRYHALAEVCREIEGQVGGPDDPRVRKIEELMWTFLRLLSHEEALDRFLEVEAKENVPGLLEAAHAEVADLEKEVLALRNALSPAVSTKERLLNSRRELAATLEKRAARLEDARANLELVRAEQERLDQQIKLLRADAIATRDSAGLSARIDATTEQLAATNAWLREMDRFRDQLGGDVPTLPARVGFGPATGAPPPLPTRQKERT
jgi:chromosome segregation ATPase